MFFDILNYMLLSANGLGDRILSPGIRVRLPIGVQIWLDRQTVKSPSHRMAREVRNIVVI